jgi:hypothetical protein
VGDITGIPMTKEYNRGLIIYREKPAMELHAVFRIKKDILVIQLKLLWREVKRGLREKDIEVFDPVIKDNR